jgi:FlaA1/EpsC-like NDP-sugar epimerase
MLDPLVGDMRDFWVDLALTLPFIVAIHIVANALAGAYGHVWEHASTNEAGRVVIANAISSTTVLLLVWWARDSFEIVVPYAVVIVGSLLSLFMMGMIRFRSRLFSFRKAEGSSRILVVGDGAEAAAFARRAGGIEGGGRVIGFLTDSDDDSPRVRRLAGLPILGSLSQIADVVAAHNVDQLLVVGSDPERAQQVVDHCLSIDVRLRILPVVEDVMRDRRAALDVRDIRVEDLLVRPPVATDMSEVAALIEGKSVLVTGAGGSIGSEVVRQVLLLNPGSVWALDRDETLLHDARLRWPGATSTVLGDVRDARAILRTFERIRPEVVFHAAALKHVPVLQGHPEEAVLTNVIGTRNVIEAGSRSGMKHFVLISTDKAVDPSSVMGASKRVAELLVNVAGERQDGCTYSAVRFGNVLGSRGSVIPTFVGQIKAGGPVTVTDPEMTRYFMTVDESVQLVLQASALARGSEVFLLDMGEPVRIEDLARRLIRLAGLSPGVDIEIRYIGRRPGEKLSESLSNGPLQPTSNPKILEVRLEHPGAYIVLDAVAGLEEAALEGDRDNLIVKLNRLAEGALDGKSEGMVLPETQLTPSWS